MIKNVSLFRAIFEQNGLVSKNLENEIVIIYDYLKKEICNGISSSINHHKNLCFYDLEGLSIKIIYCKSIYPLYSIEILEQVNKRMYDELKQENSQLKNEIEQVKKEIKEVKLELNEKKNS